MFDWLKQLLKTHYVVMLESEVQRLRAENRALMNSLLGSAGFPPVEFPATPAAQPLPRLRRRSWHQMQAQREADAGREAVSGRESQNR